MFLKGSFVYVGFSLLNQLPTTGTLALFFPFLRLLFSLCNRALEPPLHPRRHGCLMNEVGEKLQGKSQILSFQTAPAATSQ